MKHKLIMALFATGIAAFIGCGRRTSESSTMEEYLIERLQSGALSNSSFTNPSDLESVIFELQTTPVCSEDSIKFDKLMSSLTKLSSRNDSLGVLVRILDLKEKSLEEDMCCLSIPMGNDVYAIGVLSRYDPQRHRMTIIGSNNGEVCYDEEFVPNDGELPGPRLPLYKFEKNKKFEDSCVYNVVYSEKVGGCWVPKGLTLLDNPIFTR